MRTSWAQGHPNDGRRDGYEVIRKGGRYPVFPRTALSEVRTDATAPATGWSRSGTACRSSRRCGPRGPAGRLPAPRPRRHVAHGAAAQPGHDGRHARAPGRPADLPPEPDDHAVGVLPRGDARDRLPPGNVEVVPPGIDPRYSPRAASARRTPARLAVGRLVPVKRYDRAHPGRWSRPGARVPDLDARRSSAPGRCAASSRSWSPPLDADDWHPLRRPGVRRRAARPLPARVGRGQRRRPARAGA